MGVHHDNLDHGGSLLTPAHAHNPRGRLSWQRPIDAPPPAAWKVISVVVLVLLLMGGLSYYSEQRAAGREQQIYERIQSNVLLLADAAADYMTAHKTDHVDEPQLVGPGKVIPRTLHAAAQESYDHLEFSFNKPMVWVNIPDGKRVYFQINWSARGAPGFVSAPMPVSRDSIAPQ